MPPLQGYIYARPIFYKHIEEIRRNTQAKPYWAWRSKIGRKNRKLNSPAIFMDII